MVAAKEKRERDRDTGREIASRIKRRRRRREVVACELDTYEQTIRLDSKIEASSTDNTHVCCVSMTPVNRTYRGSSFVRMKSVRANK